MEKCGEIVDTGSIERTLARLVGQYAECAIRHNTLVDTVEEHNKAAKP